MIKGALCLVALLAIGTGWAVELQCHDTVPDFKLKQRYINHLVDLINKPIYPGYTPIQDAFDGHELKHIGELSPDKPFSLFDERTWKEAREVIDLLLDASDFEHFVERANLLHERVNDDLFLYCLSVVVLHRNDTQGVHVPPVHKIYPDKFLKLDVINKMKRLAKKSRYFNEKPVIDATDYHENHLEPNHDLMYFLEDIGMNSYHYDWHVMYSALWNGDDISRQGEMFVNMHKKMVNRYDIERLANGMPRVKPFNAWNEPIEDGFNSHLLIDRIGYRYAFRPPHMILRNLRKLSKNQLLVWEQRILNSVHRGIVIAENGSYVPLDDHDGIDVLAKMVEASVKSINKGFYGNIHSYAHVLAGKITDPDDRFGGSNGVMFDVATSARDPLFYSWHKYLDKIFQEHKKQLTPYTTEELTFPSVKITRLLVHGENSTEDNVLRTYWQESLLKVKKGFTFTGDMPILVRVTHLQHEDFHYEIDVENGGAERRAVVRISLVPLYDETNHSLSMEEKRNLAIDLDKFVVPLKSGVNKIVRHSNESNLVTPWTHIFDDKYKTDPLDHCHCGWPDYLMIPKGNYEGMHFGVAVVITDWDEEKVDQPENCHCSEPTSYCGDVDHLYPDTRAMGFPFDRKLAPEVWENFGPDNIDRVTIKVKFTGKTLPPKNIERLYEKERRL